MANTNILITTTTFPRWANDPSPAFIYNLGRHYKEKGMHPVILAPFHKGAQKEEMMEGLKVYRFRYFPFQTEALVYEGGALVKFKKNPLLVLQLPFFILCQLWAIKRIVKKEEIAAIHAQWILPQGFVAALYRTFFNRKISMICTSHGSDLLGLKHPVFNIFKKFTCRRMDHVSVVSQHLKGVARQFAGDTPLSVIPMGVNTQRFRPEETYRNIKKKLNIVGPMLLYIGRLSTEKGVINLMHIMAKIHPHHPDATLVVIGGGILIDTLRAMCQELDIEKNVVFIDQVDNKDLNDYYNSADIVVGPSHYEAFGIVFAEALAAGCCVVTNELPGLNEVVINNKTGYTVEALNDQAMADKINDILSHPKMLNAFREAGRNHVVEHFDAASLTEKYIELLQSKT